MSRPDDLVAYVYQADLHCPRCIIGQLSRSSLYGIDRPTTVTGAEAALDAQARLVGIDRLVESTFDSGEFPKVVFRHELARCEHCQGAGTVEVLYGRRGRQCYGRDVRCGECDGAGTTDRCADCRERLGE
jgi:hypothetical protein